MKDDSPILESLRFMRGNHMQDNPEYRDLLMLYDVVGPVLAKAIKADENRRSVAEDIFVYLKKATKFIFENVYNFHTHFPFYILPPSR